MKRLTTFFVCLCLNALSYGQAKLPELIVSENDTLVAVTVRDFEFIQTKALPLVEVIYTELKNCDSTRITLRLENKELQAQVAQLESAIVDLQAANEVSDRIDDNQTKSAKLLKKELRKQRWIMAGKIVAGFGAGLGTGFAIGKLTQ